MTKFTITVLHISLSIGSFWLMGQADSRLVLFIMGTAFAAFALMEIIRPRQSKHIN